MVLKYFIGYIGIFTACSVALSVFVKQLSPGFAASGKKPIFYGIFAALVASATGYLSSFIVDHLFSVFWFLASIYFLFGIIHVTFVQKKYFQADKQNNTKRILAEVLFGLSVILFSIVIFSSLQYFLSGEKDFLFYPMLFSTVTFFIPFLFAQTFDAAYNIPIPIYKVWQYPINSELEVPEEKAGEKIIVMAFEIPKKLSDTHRTVFRAKAPDGILLGELFYHFINDYNDLHSETPIEYADKQFEPSNWIFRRKPKWYQFQKILDPDISIRENKITENSVIICDRINS